VTRSTEKLVNHYKIDGESTGEILGNFQMNLHDGLTDIIRQSSWMFSAATWVGWMVAPAWDVIEDPRSA